MALDFGSIVPEAAEKQSSGANNPTIPWVLDSFDNAVWRRVPVPANEARGVVTLLNAAAEELDKGIRIRVLVGRDEFVPNKEFWEKLATAGARPVYVMYEAKKRSRRPRKSVADVPPAS